MSRSLFRISSVIRWLLVVAGCVALEAAQPAFTEHLALSDPSTEGTAVVEPREEPLDASEDSLIYPRGREPSDASPRAPAASGLGWATWVIAFAMIGGGAWLFWRKKQEALRPGVGRKIQIEETRPMGNRQYLVVANCEGRRFLLGVTPGRIDRIATLDEVEPEA